MRFLELLAHRALDPPASSSLAEEEHVCSLVRPGQQRANLAPCGTARFPTLAARFMGEP
jgi:hypothetical protein